MYDMHANVFWSHGWVGAPVVTMAFDVYFVRMYM